MFGHAPRQKFNALVTAAETKLSVFMQRWEIGEQKVRAESLRPRTTLTALLNGFVRCF